MSGNGGQTTYNRSFSAPNAGQIGDGSENRVESWLNDDGAASQTRFGIAVEANGASTLTSDDQGLTNRKAKALATTGHIVAGITAKSEARDPGSAAVTLTGTNTVFPGHEMNVLAEGSIWAFVEADITSITPGSDKVYARYATNGAGKSQLGAFRTDGDSSHADLVKGARWLSGVFTTPSGEKVAELYFSAAAEYAALIS